jgi:hypothetical protein
MIALKFKDYGLPAIDIGEGLKRGSNYRWNRAKRGTVLMGLIESI